MTEQNIIVETYTIPKLLGIKEPQKSEPIATDGSGQLYAENKRKSKVTRIERIY